MSDQPPANSPDAAGVPEASQNATQDLSQALAGEVFADAPEPAAALAALAASEALAADPTAEDTPSADAALAALASQEAVAADPTDEERLAQRREALAAVSGPRHTQFTYCLCLCVAMLGLAQAYFALILSSWALVLCGLCTLLVGYMAWQKAHWMQFNLRTALVGMMLVSLPFAWVGSQVRRYYHEEAAMALLEEEWQTDTARDYQHLPTWFRDACPADWLPVFGHVRSVVVRNTSFSDEQLPLIDAFQGLEVLDLSYTQVTDAGVERLTRHRGVQWLSLEGTKVTHKALVPLRLLTLSQLNVVDTGITNADAREFRKRYPKVQTASGHRRWRPNSRLVGATPTPQRNVFKGAFEDLDLEIEQELEERASKALAEPLQTPPAPVDDKVDDAGESPE